MEFLTDFLKIVAPSVIVLLGMFLVIKTLITKDFEKNNLEIKSKTTEVILPIRLQAYERMCLFLERISPNNLIIRVNTRAITAGDLHQMLLFEIREEYNHNLSQQLYMSEQVWSSIRTAMEEVIVHINHAASTVDPEMKSVDLAKAIFETMLNGNADPTGNALQLVKSEIQTIF